VSNHKNTIMAKVELDTQDYLKYKARGMLLQEYVTLLIAYYHGPEVALKCVNDPIMLKTLEREGYIKIIGESLDFVLRQDAIDMFEGREVLEKQFDEFFEAFPIKTPDGRMLRAATKNSENYKRARNKYIAKVKKAKDHEFVMKVLRARVESGDIKYMNNIETYINQKRWEIDASKYLTEDPTEDDFTRNTA